MRLSNVPRGLCIANVVALPFLSLPAFGFIHYMNLSGVPLFAVVAWVSLGLLVPTMWESGRTESLAVHYLRTLAASFLPCVLGWAVSLHPLYWTGDEAFRDLALWVRDAIFLGGAFTSGYWLPASIVNCLVLRRRAA